MPRASNTSYPPYACHLPVGGGFTGQCLMKHATALNLTLTACVVNIRPISHPNSYLLSPPNTFPSFIPQLFSLLIFLLIPISTASSSFTTYSTRSFPFLLMTTAAPFSILMKKLTPSFLSHLLYVTPHLSQQARRLTSLSSTISRAHGTCCYPSRSIFLLPPSLASLTSSYPVGPSTSHLHPLI